MYKKLLVSVFLFFFIFSFSVVSQEFKVLTQEKEWKVKMQAKEKDSGVIIYVDTTIGNDKKGKGTKKKQYKTIGRALEVAESGDTIKVGPGVYYESLDIRAPDQIILEGSGSGSTTIEGTIYENPLQNAPRLAAGSFTSPIYTVFASFMYLGNSKSNITLYY